MIQLSLQPEAEERIDRQLASGNFDTKEQVVETALVLLDRERPLRDGGPPRSHEVIPYTTGNIVSSGGPLGEGTPVADGQTGTIKGVATEEGQLALFPDDTQGTEPSAGASQSWLAPKQQALTDAHAREKDTLLAAIADSRLGTMEQRVAFILHRYPETRDNATALAIKYWTRFQPDVLEQWDRLDLNVLYDLHNSETIDRIRRHIQNDLRMFVASDYTRSMRQRSQAEFGEYLAAQRSDVPEVRFYLDETGNEGGKMYKGVAGICTIEWRQYEKHWASLRKWRDGRQWPETIRFADTGSTLQPKALELIAQLQRRRGGLLFVGYAILSRGSTHQTLLSLFIQLISDSLHHLDQLKCLVGAKALHVIKEAEAGFDKLYLDSFRRDLAAHLTAEFPNRVYLKDIDAVPKGREVFLECADLIAGAMQRRALCGGRNPKDVLAEAVFNVTGFEDPSDNGTVFRAYIR